MKVILILAVFFLQGCVEGEETVPCPEYYVYDYEYITLDDGSVITGAPIYKCRWFD